MVCESSLKVEVKSLASGDPTLPPLVLQVTKMVGTYMLWVGVSTNKHGNGEQAILDGSLCKDWACAMPPSKTVSGPLTPSWENKMF